MTTPTPTCPTCGKPLATQADGDESERHQPGGGCECLVCMRLCWKDWWDGECQNEPIDWRAKYQTARRDALMEAARAVCPDWCTVHEAFQVNPSSPWFHAFGAGTVYCKAGEIHTLLSKEPQ